MYNKSVLVISNNPFSDRENNGKTLFSIFKHYPSNKLNQLYFENSKPTILTESNFYRITDKEMLYNFIGKDKQNDSDNLIYKKKKNPSNLKRIIRELIWSRNRWRTDSLIEWLDIIKPDSIFFLAGDSGFAYNIVQFVSNKYNTKLTTYVTDDYILPIKTLNIFYIFRRIYIRKKMLNSFKKSEKIFTISPVMQEKYKKNFKINSSVLANITHYKCKDKEYEKTSRFKIVYAGGLHYDRLESIITIANTIKDNNLSEKFSINIFTDSFFNKKRINKYQDIISVSSSVDQEKLQLVYEDADILLHVESFKKKNINKTKLSLSTKIPEYILTNRIILAYGPRNVASMQFLSDISLSCFNKKQLLDKLIYIIKHPEKLPSITTKAMLKYTSIYRNIDLKEVI